MKNLLQLTLVSTLLVACGGTSDSTDTKSEIVKDTTISQVDKKPVNACDILESSIKIAFNDATELKKAKDVLAESLGKDYVPKDCHYRFKSQNAFFDVGVDLWKVHSKYANDEALMKKVSYLNAKKTEEINGVGEKAFADTISNRVVAMKNKNIIQTYVWCVGNPQCSRGKKIGFTLTNSIFDVLDK